MTWHLPVPENAVPDSARGEVAVVGDVMGPSLEVCQFNYGYKIYHYKKLKYSILIID